MPFKIACSYSDPSQTFIPSDDQLKRYIEWLRMEIGLAMAALSGPVAIGATLGPTATSVSWTVTKPPKPTHAKSKKKPKKP